MEILKFKTNIKCLGCIAQVTSALNNAVGEKNWNVDIQNPDKILTVSSVNSTKDAIRQAVEKAGFKAEELN